MQKITEEVVVNGLTVNCTKEWAKTFITLTAERFDKDGTLVKPSEEFKAALATLYTRSESEVLIPHGFITKLATHFRVHTSVLRGTSRTATDIQKDPLAVLILQKQQELEEEYIKIEDKLVLLNDRLVAIHSEMAAYNTVVANFGLDK